jgi:hypothetical protein
MGWTFRDSVPGKRIFLLKRARKLPSLLLPRSRMSGAPYSHMPPQRKEHRIQGKPNAKICKILVKSLNGKDCYAV